MIRCFVWWLAVDGLVSFSSFPLTLVTYFGLCAAGLAFVLMVWTLVEALITQTAPGGWAITIVVVLFMSAVQLISLGIMGEYIRRIFVEVKGRPSYLVREVRGDRAGARDRASPRFKRKTRTPNPIVGSPTRTGAA